MALKQLGLHDQLTRLNSAKIALYRSLIDMPIPVSIPLRISTSSNPDLLLKCQPNGIDNRTHDYRVGQPFEEPGGDKSDTDTYQQKPHNTG